MWIQLQQQQHFQFSSMLYNMFIFLVHIFPCSSLRHLINSLWTHFKKSSYVVVINLVTSSRSSIKIEETGVGLIIWLRISRHANPFDLIEIDKFRRLLRTNRQMTSFDGFVRIWRLRG